MKTIFIAIVAVFAASCTRTAAVVPNARDFQSEFTFLLGINYAVVPFPDFGWCREGRIVARENYPIHIEKLIVDGRPAQIERFTRVGLPMAVDMKAESSFTYLYFVGQLESGDEKGYFRYLLPAKDEIVEFKRLEADYRVRCPSGRESPLMHAKGTREDVARMPITPE